MKKLLYIFLTFSSLLLFNGCKSFPHGSEHYNIESVIEATEEKGITAIIHGADHKRKLYVISWSNPQSFFNRYNFSIAPSSPEIRQLFSTLNRGDKVFIQGKVDVNHGQAHILVKQLRLEKTYDPKVKHPAGKFARTTQLPGTLTKTSREVFYIHAIANNGKILVLEHGDTIVPMSVKNNKLTENLYRGDYVELCYTISKSDNPHRPTHLQLDEKVKQPIKVLDSLVKLHDKEVEYTGRMVMFPKSPTINKNIFAVEVNWQDPSKAARYFTLLPKDFTSENFKTMLKKLQDAWDKHPEGIFKGRNKYIHLDLIIKIKGKANIISENQANAQIFAHLEDLQIMEKPQ
jgi:hypothetical protein